MRPKRTEAKEESSPVQMKAAETAQRVTLLSEEAERVRNVRQQMNIPSIRKKIVWKKRFQPQQKKEWTCKQT